MFTTTSVRGRLLGAASLLCLLMGWCLWRMTPTAHSQHAPQADQVRAAFGRLPLWFEANRGQAAHDVQFLSRSRNAVLALTANSARLHVGATAEDRATVELRFRHARPSAALSGRDALPGRSHYLLGNAPQRWRRDVPQFARVEYDELYPGVDLVFYGRGQTLEYDLIVAPNADPRRIELEFKGARQVRLNERGDLVLSLPCGDVIQKAPVAYQQTAQGRELVAARYELDQRGRVRFAVGEYDRAQTLVIDPVIEYSTYLGGESSDQGYAIAVDSAGNAYVTGTAASLSFPGPSPIQASRGGQTDTFVAKLNPSGSALVYATYLGGNSTETPNAIALDAQGNVVVTGSTFSTDFPLTVDAAQRTLGGNIDAFITKLDASGSTLMFSTLFGGNGSDAGFAVALDAAGNVVAAGSTSSSDLPNLTLSGAVLYQSSNRGANWNASVKGLGGSTISVLAVAPSDSRYLLAQTESGLFNSTDGGANWTRVNTTNFVSNIVIDPKNPQTHYLLTSFNSLAKTVNGGQSYQTFQIRTFNFTVNNSLSLAIDPNDPRILYLGAREGVFKTTDGGATWTQLPLLGSNPNQAQVTQVVLDPVNPAFVYAVSSSFGLFKSSNGGAAWSSLTITGLPGFSTVNALVIDPKNPQTLYVAFNLFNLAAGTVYQSNDGGQTWRDSSRGLSYQSGTQTIPLSISRLVLDPTTATLYAAASSGGLFRSTDDGANWSLTRNGLNNLFVRALAVGSNGVVHAGTAGGTDGFVVKLNAAGTAFTQARLLGGSETDEVRGVAFDNNGDVVVAGATVSYNFPTRNPLQAANGGFSDFQPTTDGFVARLNPTTLELLTSTYLGGLSNDQVRALTVDGSGNIYLVGITTSINFPTTANALQPVKSGGTDLFVAKLNAAGTALTYSTYLGGNREDISNGIAVDSAGQVYVIGQSNSTDYPTVNGVQGPTFLFANSSNVRDAIVSKLSANGASLLFSTYLGGVNDEVGIGIAVDAQRAIYVTGGTVSTDFPLVAPLRGSNPNSVDGYVTKFAPRADLAVTSAAQHSPVLASQPYSYTVTVTNLGADEASDVRLSERVPDGLTNVTITSSAGAAACTGAPNLQCRLGELAVGAAATVTIAGTAPATGTLEQTATVTSATIDPVMTNNRATLTTTVSASPSLAGRVALGDGKPLAGATLALTGGATATRLSNANGGYQFTELVKGGTYNVAAQRAGYVIRPLTLSFPNVQTDQTANFTATLCTFNVTASQTGFPATGGTATLTVTAADALCAWQARSNDPWITLNAPGGVGNGSTTFTVAPTNVARVGTISIGGRTITVTQEFNVCARPNFRIAQTIEFPRGSQRLESGDFNRDQLTDLVLSDAQNISLLLGNGMGGFGTPQAVATALNAQEQLTALVVGDLNGDGRSDLAALGFLSTSGTSTYSLLTWLANPNGGFAPARRTAMPNGSSTRVFTTALLNDDNRADILNTNNNGNLTAWLSNADGTFTAVSSATTQVFSLQAFATGDLNKDGRTDLVTATTGSMAIYQGDGAGRFQTPVTVNTNFNASSFGALALADLNRDGNLDVAVGGGVSTSGAATGQIAVFNGDGSGRVSEAARYPAPPSLAGLAARDFNNDGLLDLIALNTGTGFGLYLNTATGLRPPIYFSAGSNSNAFIAADFDRDNRLDLLTMSDSLTLEAPSGSTTGWLILLKALDTDFNAGRRTLLTPANASVTQFSVATAVGDFNNDGRADTVALQSESGSGPTAYALVTRLSAGTVFAGEIRTTTTEQFGLVARDFNRDGKLDVITRGTDSLNWLAGDGTGRFQLTARLTSPQPVINTGNVQVRLSLPIAVEDFNRDGRDDVVTFNPQRQPTLYLGTNQGGANQGGIDGSFIAARNFGVGANANDLYAGDFNGDGNPDVLAVLPLLPGCSSTGATVMVFLGDGQGGFNAGRRFTLPIQPTFLLVEDLNGDGRSDVASLGGCFTFTQLALLYGGENGELAAAVAPITLPYDPSALASGDLNNDGRKDLLLALNVSQSTNPAAGLFALLQRPNGEFAAPALFGPSERALSLAIADFNGDGLNDVFSYALFSSNTTSHWFTVFPNNCLTTRALAAASAASYSNAALAPDSIVAVFGTGLATATAVARTNPLPLELSGTRVTVTDSTALERPARLFFVSPTQVNFLLPAGLLGGTAQIKIVSGDNVVSTGAVRIAPIAPGLFTANADGRGVAAALTLRVRADGIQRYEPLAQLDAQTNRFVPLPIDFGVESDQLFLVLFGTGLRGRTSLANVTARVGGVNVPVLYAGPQNELAGLDQLNLSLPRSLKGRGEVDVQVTVDGQIVNVVRIALR